MTGLDRNLEPKVTRLLELFPAVLLLGVRQAGKTTLARRCRPDWNYVDAQNYRDRELLADPGLFFREHPSQVIIDEAQEVPELFAHLRGVIDGDRSQKGRFLLTGSSSPQLLSAASETLAGRVGIVEVGTLKFNERFERPFPAFYDIFKEPLSAKTHQTVRQLEPWGESKLMDHFLWGGYPEPSLADEEAHGLWMDAYYRTYVERDIGRLFPRLDANKFRRFVSILSTVSGTVVNRAQLGTALDISEVTVRDYLDIVEKTFVWRNIPAFADSKVKSAQKMPKGYLRDSGLAHYLSRIQSRDALLRSPTVGHTFEAFVIEEIIRGLQATQITAWDVSFLRTKNGAEVDLILRGPFGLLPIEIKFGTKTAKRSLRSLEQFLDRHELEVGVVISQAPSVHKLTERIVEVPAACL